MRTGITDAPDRHQHMLNLIREMHSCERCDLRQGCKGVVYGADTVFPKLMLVVGHPVRNHRGDEDLLPVDQYRFFWEALKNLGLIEVYMWGPTPPFTYAFANGGFFLTSAVKCAPAEGKHPHAENIKLCLPWLGKQLALVKPRVVVAMGNTALSALTGTPMSHCRILDVRGKPFTASDSVTTIVPTHDPGYIRHLASNTATGNATQALRDMTTDLELAKKLSCQ